MRVRNHFRRRAVRRASAASIAIVMAAGFAAPGHAATPSKQNSVPGVSVEATLIPVRWLDLIPTRTVRFELTITVERQVKSFSGIEYECLFIDAEGTEIGTASRGSAGRDAFTAAADGRLVSVAHEELADIGPVKIRCRATKLEK